MPPNKLFQFLDKGFTQTKSTLGEEKALTYEGQSIKGLYNEKSLDPEFDYGGKNKVYRTTFLMQNSDITEAGVTIQDDKKCTLDGKTWKIDKIIDGPVATMIELGDPNESKVPG
ncbi:MAG: hypothetical protein NE327_09140 [Lentisphaeraceae bacterium]|nr:hypothetical protein [Lentisphaeraceae bacterium]